MGASEQFIEKILNYENTHSVNVIIKKQDDDNSEWIYSERHIKLLKEKCLIKFSRKTERMAVIRKIIDLYYEKKIGVVSIHAAFICLFHTKPFSLEFEKADTLNVKLIGQKRMNIVGTLPEIRIISDEDFLMNQLKDIIT